VNLHQYYPEVNNNTNQIRGLSTGIASWSRDNERSFGFQLHLFHMGSRLGV